MFSIEHKGTTERVHKLVDDSGRFVATVVEFSDADPHKHIHTISVQFLNGEVLDAKITGFPGVTEVIKKVAVLYQLWTFPNLCDAKRAIVRRLRRGKMTKPEASRTLLSLGIQGWGSYRDRAENTLKFLSGYWDLKEKGEQPRRPSDEEVSIFITYADSVAWQL